VFGWTPLDGLVDELTSIAVEAAPARELRELELANH
jgi:hypothetical protein